MLSVMPTFASVTINLNIGIAYQVSNATVADGTLWALIVDDGDNNLTGISLTGNGGSLSGAGSANTFFTTGQTLQIGNNLSGGATGDRVFAMGGFNSTALGAAGSTQHTIADLVLGTNGLTAGRSYAFYWFPGATYTGAGSYSISGYSRQIGSQVGGISNITNDTGNANAMLVPSDGQNLPQGAYSVDVGGRWTVSNFTAVQLVPEPTSSLLSMLGGLTLLFRRRRSA